MILFKTTRDIQNYLASIRQQNLSIGFVPTMGALHAGHLSLIRESIKRTGVTVCSIFINPTQFNNAEDFERYPVTLEQDILALEESGCHVLFLPSEQEIYPDESSRHRPFDLGYLGDILEGSFRPGHFQGVCMVVEKLLDTIRPDLLFLGQKDYQQCLVIKRLIATTNLPVTVRIESIVRESSGLAMSSRNQRLGPQAREKAALLQKTLRSVARRLSRADFSSLRTAAVASLEQEGFHVDYLELAGARDLKPVSVGDPSQDAVLLIAAYIDGVRLIDNILIKAEK